MSKKQTTHQKQQQQQLSKPPEDPEVPYLRLRVEDAEDLKVASALLQDAIINPSAMHYNPDQELFTILANRFCWEHAPMSHPDGELFRRIHTGVHFSHVHDVTKHGIDQKDLTAHHNLIGLKSDPKLGIITLIFSGGAEVRLSIHDLLCHVTDLSEHWYTHNKPDHGLEDGDDEKVVEDKKETSK